jgi:hypothetical protein
VRPALVRGVSLAWIAVSGSNGFWAFADAWDTQVSLQTGDPGPGQTLQATSYQAVGEIVWMTCEPYWDCSDPGEHVEHGSAQASVVPQPAPSISQLSPGSGIVGTTVTISGAHFTTTPGTVTFNGVGASVTQWSDTSLTATVPATTSGNVVVTAGGQTSNVAWFTVTTPPPTGDGGAPPGGERVSQVFTAQYSSPAGTGDIAAMRLQVVGAGGPAGPDAASCYVMYQPGAATVYLLDDAGTHWDPRPYGSGPPLANNQCAVDVAAFTAVATGTQWTLTIPITFAPAWVGTWPVQLWAVNQAGSPSGWHLLGYWTVPAPAISGLTPAQGGVDAEVTIAGVHFGPAPGEVRFHGTPATHVTAWTPTSITARKSPARRRSRCWRRPRSRA